jgi:hypothetical protein
MNSDSAAAENEPCSAAARKYVSCCRVIGFTFRCGSQSSIQRYVTGADTGSMFIALVILTVGVAGALKFGAEDRPGFNERRPLS